jgi:DNA-binding HxlR family transcriptional regulator
MPLRSDWSTRRCPIARSLDVVGDPWVVLVIREALQGVSRFEEFREALQVSDSVLSVRLRAMVEAGLLDKVPYKAGNRTHHEYVLTDAGADLMPVVQALVLWGERYRPFSEPGQLTIVHEGCGAQTVSADMCSHCGSVLTPAEVSWRRPWRDPVLTPLAR